jgi:hypothetical protein
MNVKKFSTLALTARNRPPTLVRMGAIGGRGLALAKVTAAVG